MKTFIILSCILAVAVADTYTSKFDDLDIMEIMENPTLLKNYYNCLMETGPCTAEGKELKEHITEAMSTDCAKCTETQKTKSKQAIDYLFKNDRAKFDAVGGKYDSNGEWRKSHGYA